MMTALPIRMIRNRILQSILVAGALVAGVKGFAQVPSTSNSQSPLSGIGGSSSSGAQSNGTTSLNPLSATLDNGQSRDASSTGTDVLIGTSAQVLSADQIFAVLQEEPDAMIELKQLVADQAQQQGTSIQPEDISDQMLYSRISSNADLRANITTFFRARGYVSDSTVQGFAAGASLLDPSSMQSSSSPLSMQQDTTGAASNSISGQTNSSLGAMRDSQLNNGNNERTNATRNEPGTPRVLRRPVPYNLLSLRDLYTQLPEQNGSLKRFGSDVFLRRGMSTGQTTASSTPMDIPAGPNYVVGPGDTLSISMWGGMSQNLTRIVDREGRVNLPDAGVVQVSGLSLERTEGAIASALRQQYRGVQVSVTVSRLRSIRIFVVGDVQRPGAYEVGSLSTPLSALYSAGGPTSAGSLRTLKHYRGKELVGEIDLYDFLLHGVQIEERLQAGDTLLVPPVGPQVAVYGAVKRPAIYELKLDVKDAMLAEILADAGGITVSASLGHIVIDRIDENKQRETVTLDLPKTSELDGQKAAVAKFVVRDGDRVHVSPILPYSQRVVYVDGHVVRPGRMAYHDGMQLNDVIRSYQDMLPEPAERGEIVRLVAPDLHPQTIEFNVPDVLIGNANIPLQPFDTVRIMGRYEADAPRVSIRGEVVRPGTYSLAQGMTAAQLVRMAGGFKRDALLLDADLTSYQIVDEKKIVGERSSVRIGDAVLRHESGADVALKPGDVLTIHQLTGWNDIGASVQIEGEMAHPGSYGFKQGERLSSVLRRAGGFRDTSYPAGAVLIREEVRQLEEKSRQELIRQIETSSSAARISPSIGGGDQSATLQLIAQQQHEVLDRLKNTPATGRLVIHISADISSWENTSGDIEMRAGDILRIPKRPEFVLVSGQVYNASAITYAPGRTASWYLRRAGGATEVANTKDIFVIRANGTVVGRESGTWFDRDVLSTKLDPGDVVVVPQKIIGASLFWRNLLTIAQITSSIAITAAVAGIL